MRVINFDKVLYDGYVSLDLTSYILKSNPKKVFKLLLLIPRLFLYLINRIDDKRLIEDFYLLLLKNITISELEVFKINNISKLDLNGFGIDENDIIVTGEPAFLIDLFIDRSKYTVICTEYDLHNHLFTDELCFNDVKALKLKSAGYHRINQLFVANFKEKELMKMADDVFIYRDHEVIDLDTYKPKLRDRLMYNISSSNAVILVIISIFTMLISFITGAILTYFSDITASFIVSYFVWMILLYPMIVHLLYRKSFTVDYLFKFILSFVPNFLMQAIVIMFLGRILGFYALPTLLLAQLIAYPFLIFILVFNRFNNTNT